MQLTHMITVIAQHNLNEDCLNLQEKMVQCEPIQVHNKEAILITETYKSYSFNPQEEMASKGKYHSRGSYWGLCFYCCSWDWDNCNISIEVSIVNHVCHVWQSVHVGILQAKKIKPDKTKPLC